MGHTSFGCNIQSITEVTAKPHYGYEAASPTLSSWEMYLFQYIEPVVCKLLVFYGPWLRTLND